MISDISSFWYFMSDNVLSVIRMYMSLNSLLMNEFE